MAQTFPQNLPTIQKQHLQYCQGDVQVGIHLSSKRKHACTKHDVVHQQATRLAAVLPLWGSHLEEVVETLDS